MISSEELSLLHKYLEEDLSESEASIFKKRFYENPEFAKEVQHYKNLSIALKTASSFRLRQTKQAKQFKLTWPVFSIAATISLLIVIGGLYIWDIYKVPGHMELYYAYYESPMKKDEGASISRSLDSEADKDNIEAFISAIDYMERGDFKASVIILKSLLEVNNDILRDDIEWYLALSYLGNNDLAEAKNILIFIINSNSIHSSSARNLYEQLT